MSDDVREALSLLGRSFGDELGRDVEQAVGVRHRRNKKLRAAARVVAIVTVASSAAVLGARQLRQGPAHVALDQGSADRAGTGSRTVRFDDGSEVTLLDAASTLRPRRVTAEQTVVELVGGSARFNVVRTPSREFRAEAGVVSINVLGTVFTVDKLGRRARVSVERGRVRVTWPGGEAHLSAGHTDVFPPSDSAAQAPDETPPAVAPIPAETTPSPPAPAPGRHALPTRASAALTPVAPPSPRSAAPARDQVEDLLSAADLARRSRRPQDAVLPLRQVLDAHPDDQRAPLAAFTLGRLLLDDLRVPADAAAAYARARALAPRGPLAEHALAREVEAWAAAGDRVRAQAAARLYLDQYPEGSRAESVRRFGGKD